MIMHSLFASKRAGCVIFTWSIGKFYEQIAAFCLLFAADIKTLQTLQI